MNSTVTVVCHYSSIGLSHGRLLRYHRNDRLLWQSEKSELVTHKLPANWNVLHGMTPYPDRIEGAFDKFLHGSLYLGKFGICFLPQTCRSHLRQAYLFRRRSKIIWKCVEKDKWWLYTQATGRGQIDLTRCHPEPGDFSVIVGLSCPAYLSPNLSD